MTMSMEQRRAADAWRCSEGCTKAYATLAKGLPALIMNSGLMQTVAFLQDKGDKRADDHHRVLGSQLRAWLSQNFPEVLPRSEYRAFMEALMRAEPRQFQEITAEAMAWLRWLRQIASTRVVKEES